MGKGIQEKVEKSPFTPDFELYRYGKQLLRCWVHKFCGERKGIGFFRFPLSDKARCAMWAAAVHRKNWHPKAHTRICGVHFTSGKQLR